MTEPVLLTDAPPDAPETPQVASTIHNLPTRKHRKVDISQPQPPLTTSKKRGTK